MRLLLGQAVQVDTTLNGKLAAPEPRRGALVEARLSIMIEIRQVGRRCGLGLPFANFTASHAHSARTSAVPASSKVQSDVFTP